MEINESKHNVSAVLTAHGIAATLTTDEAAAAINRKPQTLRNLRALLDGSAFALPALGAEITQHVNEQSAR